MISRAIADGARRARTLPPAFERLRAHAPGERRTGGWRCNSWPGRFIPPRPCDRYGGVFRFQSARPVGRSGARPARLRRLSRAG